MRACTVFLRQQMHPADPTTDQTEGKRDIDRLKSVSQCQPAIMCSSDWGACLIMGFHQQYIQKTQSYNEGNSNINLTQSLKMNHDVFLYICCFYCALKAKLSHWKDWDIFKMCFRRHHSLVLVQLQVWSLHLPTYFIFILHEYNDTYITGRQLCKRMFKVFFLAKADLCSFKTPEALSVPPWINPIQCVLTFLP